MLLFLVSLLLLTLLFLVSLPPLPTRVPRNVPHHVLTSLPLFLSFFPLLTLLFLVSFLIYQFLPHTLTYLHHHTLPHTPTPLQILIPSYSSFYTYLHSTNSNIYLSLTSLHLYSLTNLFFFQFFFLLDSTPHTSIHYPTLHSLHFPHDRTY